jgi:hypothetical protein
MIRFIKVIMAFLIPFILGIVFAVVGVNLLLQHYAGGYIVNIFNKKAPELFKNNISIKGASVSLWKGEIALKEMQVMNGEQTPVLFVPEIVIALSLQDLLSDRLAIQKVSVIRPVYSSSTKKATNNGSILSYITGLRSLGIGPRNMSIEKGSFVIRDSSVSVLTVFSDFDMAIENMPIDELAESQSVKLSASARIPSEKSGQISLNVDFTSFYPKFNFEGEFRAIDVFVPYFTQYFAESGDVKVQDGDLGIRTNIHCSNNWVTASSVINMGNLDLDIPSKKIFGIPADVAEQFLATNDVAFDLPVNGDIMNLKIDFRTASTQVMFKALQGRFKSESFTKRIAEGFGRKIGTKLEEIFSKII